MLDTVKQFLDLADRAGIKFCHWKSNAGLVKAVNGETDLDLLFYEADKNQVEAVLTQVGAVKFKAAKKYDKIDDFLVIDSKTGKLLHFHVHYQLDIGEKNIKNYRLPFCGDILETRIKHSDTGFWSAKPEYELILLILRQTLRIPSYYFVVKKLPLICKDFDEEFTWLKTIANIDELKKISDNLFPPEIRDFILDIVTQGISAKKVTSFRKILQPWAEKYKTDNRKISFIPDVISKIKLRFLKLLSKLGFNLRKSSRRTFCNQGIVVVFMGCDGSGKSSIAKDVCRTFAAKIDVEKIYFGYGDSSDSFLIKSSNFLARTLKSIGLKKTNALSLVAAIYVKKQNFKYLKKFKALGKMVVCDRFPQTEVPKINDGLNFEKYLTSRNFVLRKIAEYEKRVHSLRDVVVPDIIFRIKVSPETAFARKGELNLDILKHKGDVLNKLKMPQGAAVFEVENNGSYREFEIYVLNKIWDFIKNRENK